MKSPLVDTHAHLDGPEYRADLEQTLARAREAGVCAIVSAGQDEASSRAALDLARRFATVVPAVGVHPHLAKDAGDMRWLPELLDDARVVAAGEMGLDYHYDFSPRSLQRDVFVRQLGWAQERGLPAIVHCREAYDDVMELLGRHWRKDATAVVHCFTASYDIGRRLIDEHGVHLGIGGAVTFKNSGDLRDAVTRLPLERLVLETDCPYMSPVPYRGKRNEPAYIQMTCNAIAALRGMTPQAVAEATRANAFRLFPKLASVGG